MVDVHAAVYININVKQTDSVEVIKWKVHELLFIPPAMQKLSYMDELLENTNTVKFYKIRDYSTITLKLESKLINIRISVYVATYVVT